MLGLAGLYAGRTWVARTGWPGAAALSVIYLGGFGASHPLAKKVGAWPPSSGSRPSARGRHTSSPTGADDGR